MFDRIIRHGTIIAVVVLIICVIGIVAALRVPIQMIPDLEIRTVSVRTTWPGATPQDVEKEILIEQEEYLRSIPGLDRLVAVASSGEAEIELEFPFDIDLTQTLIRINNALNQVPDYPENVDQPRVYAASFSSNSFMYFYVSPLEGNPKGLDMVMMRDFVDDHVRTRMESVPDVAQVEVGGGAERQIQVLLDPARLADRDITVGDVRSALRARNRDVSGGDVETGKRRYLLRTVGRFKNLDDIRRLIVRRDGDTVVRLQDLAEVKFSHFEVSRITSINGETVINLEVRRQAGSNVIDIKYAMLAEVEAINRDLLNPSGMKMELTAEDAGYVEASILNVWINLGLGAVLATIVMYAFLRSGRATLIGVLGIPVCTIAAFIGLLLAGRSINVISLAGVAFAIGMTLDNSIVVLENIDLERRRGLSRLQAAAEGVRKVWPALLAATFTTVLVFVPIAFIEEEAGQLYSDVAVAVGASILVSMLVAFTVIPAAAANIEFNARIAGALGGRAGAFQAKVEKTVEWLLAERNRTNGIIAATVLISAFIYFVLTPAAEYLPEGEEPKAFVFMNAPPGYNIDTVEAITRDVEAHLVPRIGQDHGPFDRGETDVPAIKYCVIFIDAAGAMIVAETVKAKHVNALLKAISDKIEVHPGMQSFATRGSIITSNEGGTRSVNLDISGPSLSEIYAVATAAYRRADEIFDDPRIQARPSTLSLSQPLVEIRPDWERAEELGLDASALGFTVAAMSDGAYVDEFFYDDDKIDIYFYSRAGVDADLDDLAQVPLYTRLGGVVPLGSVAEIHETVDTSTIRRINGRRTVTLNIIPPEDVALETGIERVREELIGHLQNTGQLPAQVSIDISGASDQLDATQEAIANNYLVAVVIVYLLLVSIFRHWGYPLLIMTSIPLGVSGGILGLQLLNLVGAVLPFIGLQGFYQPFDMISMLGFLILMGTVVNNPILIVHRAMENTRKNGLGVREAVQEAVSSRLRPIMMSTVTTICGLAPLVFLPGAGTELYRGVGAIVLFGILGAAVVSLTFLPALITVVFGVFEKRNDNIISKE